MLYELHAVVAGKEYDETGSRAQIAALAEYLMKTFRIKADVRLAK